MNLGNRYYQVIYPIQLGRQSNSGVNTREVSSGYGKVCTDLLKQRAPVVKPMSWDMLTTYYYFVPNHNFSMASQSTEALMTRGMEWGAAVIGQG